MQKEAAVKSWNDLKNNGIYAMIERFRTTQMDLPNVVNNPFPASFGFEDYTNKAIEAILKRGRYMTMDELSNISAPTQAMQDSVQDSLKPGRAGGIIGAPAGFGKSYTFNYLGIMAAERSLSHPFLWFKGGALTDIKQLKNSASIEEKHFMFTDAKNLSQTGGWVGGAAGPLRELTQAARDNQGRFVLCLDELYTAMSQDSDTAGGWFALKGLTEPEVLVQIVGTMASKDIPLFKSLKVPERGQGAAGGDRDSKMKAVYDEQMKSRFVEKRVPDFTDLEQKQTLEHGGLYAVTHQPAYTLRYDDEDRQTLISDLVEKTNQIEAGVAPDNREWAAPRKWKRIISEANSFVVERQEAFAEYSADVDYLRRTDDLSKWNAALANINKEKQSIQSISNDAVVPSPTRQPEENLGVMSIRDVGDKFPHEEVESPQIVSEQKKGRLNNLQEKEQEIKNGLARINRKRRYIEMAFKQGLEKLNAKYGPGVFAEDLHDIGYLKPVDIEMVDLSKIRIDVEES